MHEGFLGQAVKGDPSAAPCPFCGCTATIIETVEPRDPEPIYHAECWRCGARGPVEDANDKALQSWNVRVRAAGVEVEDDAESRKGGG